MQAGTLTSHPSMVHSCDLMVLGPRYHNWHHTWIRGTISKISAPLLKCLCHMLLFSPWSWFCVAPPSSHCSFRIERTCLMDRAEVMCWPPNCKEAWEEKLSGLELGRGGTHNVGNYQKVGKIFKRWWVPLITSVTMLFFAAKLNIWPALGRFPCISLYHMLPLSNLS